MTIDIDEIRAAAGRIRPYVKRTSLERSSTLSQRLGTNVFVKYELFQKAGSFKSRGAFNKMLLTPPGELAKGVVAVSGGNHAQAVAYAAKVLGVDAVILMAENMPADYVEATRGYGALVELVPTISDAFDRAAGYESEGRIFIHPFNDVEVLAGAGTLGLELVEDVPDVTDVVISIGGGGFAGGVSSALKPLVPSARIWGVETVGADAMSKALEAGRPVDVPVTSIAKTLGAPYVTDLTLGLARQNLESVTVVDDGDAVREMAFIADRLRVIAEPAAACTLAAAERLKNNFPPDGRVVLILCGGNVSMADACSYISMFSVPARSD